MEEDENIKMLDKIKDYIETRTSYTKDEIIIKYFLKNIRKENKYRGWYVFILLGIVINIITFYKTLNFIYFILMMLFLIAFFELDLIQSGRLKDYKRRKEFGKYYKYYKKQKKKKCK